MLLVYMSLTGNVKNFIERVGMDSYELNPVNPYKEVNEDYIVVVPSYVGYINDDVSDFIEYKDNIKHLVGFASSGNLNFADLYCINGKELSKRYNKPLIFMFEYSGTDKDVEDFKKEVCNIEITRAKQKE
jgi:protein involved in ribonucleotide reduction